MRGTVLACYNMMIPDLCPEPGIAEKRSAQIGKTPLSYTTVALRNRQALDKLKLHSVYAPGNYHMSFRLNPQVDIGAYRSMKRSIRDIDRHQIGAWCAVKLTMPDSILNHDLICIETEVKIDSRCETTISDFKLHSTREFGLMCDCVATQPVLT